MGAGNFGELWTKRCGRRATALISWGARHRCGEGWGTGSATGDGRAVQPVIGACHRVMFRDGHRPASSVR